MCWHSDPGSRHGPSVVRQLLINKLINSFFLFTCLFRCKVAFLQVCPSDSVFLLSISPHGSIPPQLQPSTPSPLLGQRGEVPSEEEYMESLFSNRKSSTRRPDDTDVSCLRRQLQPDEEGPRPSRGASAFRRLSFTLHPRDETRGEVGCSDRSGCTVSSICPGTRVFPGCIPNYETTTTEL